MRQNSVLNFALENFDLSIPTEILRKMDDARESLDPERTREEFVLLAILWALDSIKATTELTRMGLEEEPEL